MATRIDELNQQISDLRTENENLNKTVATAKRVKSAEERTSFDTNMTKIEALEREVKDEQAVESRKIEAPVIHTAEQKTKNRTYDLGKGVKEFYQRSLTGLEAEIQQELRKTAPEGIRDQYLISRDLIYKSKRTETYANSTGLVNSLAIGLDIVGSESILDKIGVTRYDNLTTDMKLNFTKGANADSVAEGVALSGKTWTKATDTLSPVRYGYSQTVSQEGMAVTSLLVDVINDAERVIDVKFAKNLFAAIVADTANVVLPGYSASTTAAFMTYKKALALKAAVLSAIFKNPGFVMGSDLFSYLQGTTGGTLMQTAISDINKIAGFNAFDTMDIMTVHDSNKYDIIFGDWARAYVATFGSNVMGLLVNPYEFDDEGQVKLRFTKLGDVSYNPYAFKAIRNNKVV